MSDETGFDKIIYTCGVAGCDFSQNVPNPNDLSEEDACLLNDLIDPQFTPSPDQEAHLKEILGDFIACPRHGRQNVGFIVNYTIVSTAAFNITFDEDGVDIRQVE